MTTMMYKFALQYMFLGFGGQFSFNLNTLKGGFIHSIYALVLKKMLAHGLMYFIGFGQCSKNKSLEFR